jgi:hypothetical protein
MATADDRKWGCDHVERGFRKKYNNDKLSMYTFHFSRASHSSIILTGYKRFLVSGTARPGCEGTRLGSGKKLIFFCTAAVLLCLEVNSLNQESSGWVQEEIRGLDRACDPRPIPAAGDVVQDCCRHAP